MRRALVAVVMILALAATPAFAHVSVAPKDAAKGATAMFTFAVPNEEAPAKTVSVEIVFPDGVFFTTISPQDKPGWTFSRAGKSLVNSPTSPVPPTSSIKWSGGAITDENRESFVVTLGPLPSSETIVFKTLQTYDDGTVVRWIGEESTDNPAPVVTLTGAPVPVATTTPMTSPTPSDARPPVEEDESKTNTMPIVLGALVLTGIGIGIAIGARRQSGRRTE
ncbi:MAG: YcnI family protein [Acidimicrobiales bacterium]|nr:YcnI family protein [Acidimicrobiales bacterium]